MYLPLKREGRVEIYPTWHPSKKLSTTFEADPKVILLNTQIQGLKNSHYDHAQSANVNAMVTDGSVVPTLAQAHILQKPTLQRQRLKSDFSIQEKENMGFFTI